MKLLESPLKTSISLLLAMEDAHTTLLKLGDTNASFFGVFDGHGGKKWAIHSTVIGVLNVSM
jgi:serine/threonine protein phosphatase PrpC